MLSEFGTLTPCSLATFANLNVNRFESPHWEIYWNLVAPQPANSTFETHEKPALATSTHCRLCLSGAGPDVGDRVEEEGSSHSLGDLV